MVVEWPSLNSPERMRGRWLVLGEFAKYAFCGLKRKRRNFERSVLMYVSIKIQALTHSGRKSRVCVNQPDRLTQTTVQRVFPASSFFSRLTHPAPKPSLPFLPSASARQSPHVKRGQHLRAGLFQRGCLRRALEEEKGAVSACGNICLDLAYKIKAGLKGGAAGLPAGGANLIAVFGHKLRGFQLAQQFFNIAANGRVVDFIGLDDAIGIY